MRKLFFFLFLFILHSSLKAQDPLQHNFAWYKKAINSGSLFVHFDKNVYAGNEQIYFTAYILKAKDLNQHQVLSVALVRDADSTVIKQEKFVAGNGLSFGQFAVPDSIIPGNYHLNAFTNVLLNNQPELFFSQPVTIKSALDPNFKVNMQFLSKENGFNNVLVSVLSAKNTFLPKPASVIYTYNNKINKAQTSPSGQLILKIPETINQTDPNLYAKVKYLKDSTFIHMPLPQPKGNASVKFYPEGGDLIAGHKNKVGWEVKDLHKRPLSTKAILYQNNIPIDTIETSDYGIGHFFIVPDISSSYQLKLLHSDVKDSLYKLPVPLKKGLNVIIRNALPNDTLKFVANSTHSQKIIIRVHNFKDVFAYFPYQVNKGSTSFSIPLDEVPKGIKAITITDSLERPLAERLFFAHYNKEKEDIHIATDKPSYNTREKITLDLDLAETTLPSFASIACVQENRVETKNKLDIETYAYLQNELENLPVSLNGTGYKNANYAEQFLLVKGWRKYNWDKLTHIKATDTLVKTSNMILNGRATRNNKPLIKPVTLGTMGAATLSIITTQNNGNFSLNNDQLVMASGKKLYLFVNGKDNTNYDLIIDDEMLNEGIHTSKNWKNQDGMLPSALINNSELLLKANEKIIQLKEVVIKTNKDNTFYGGGPNACGDYVCRYNILNCRNHIGDPANRAPEQGKSYMLDGRTTLYTGCSVPDKKTFLEIKGIQEAKEFYVNDYKDPMEPAFFSTLYWNHGIFLKPQEKQQISFYAGDISGRFKVIVQGINAKGVIYKEYTFTVNNKK
ncbi:hypothetical protein [Pedobacter montanisoli]|uniref:Macroglobulin domain-containing protein n=1 Tax=Pedobacter montanisoli TaxID=2923277 RepID=A0ABS9ZUT0_9SPHI|nr:hypothetical protein [Pedobacter montanisoli]MCJ0742340.1 hypothetical protein [Pedobacter montanisoli]